MEPLKTLALGSEVSVAVTAESGLDGRQQCLQAERPVRTQLQKGPDTAARREPRTEKTQRYPTVSGWGGWEAGSALTAGEASVCRADDEWAGGSERDKPREHPAARKWERRPCSPEERPGVLREPPKGTVETWKGTPYKKNPTSQASIELVIVGFFSWRDLSLYVNSSWGVWTCIWLDFSSPGKCLKSLLPWFQDKNSIIFKQQLGFEVMNSFIFYITFSKGLCLIVSQTWVLFLLECSNSSDCTFKKKLENRETLRKKKERKKHQ